VQKELSQKSEKKEKERTNLKCLSFSFFSQWNAGKCVPLFSNFRNSGKNWSNYK